MLTIKATIGNEIVQKVYTQICKSPWKTTLSLKTEPKINVDMN